MAGPAPISGAQIKDARERRHQTQQQLADILGVDRKTVDNWEHGRTTPRNRIGALKAWAPELDGDHAPDPDEEALRSLDLDPAVIEALIRALPEIREQAARRRRNSA